MSDKLQTLLDAAKREASRVSTMLDGSETTTKSLVDALHEVRSILGVREAESTAVAAETMKKQLTEARADRDLWVAQYDEEHRRVVELCRQLQEERKRPGHFSFADIDGEIVGVAMGDNDAFVWVKVDKKSNELLKNGPVELRQRTA